MIRFCDRLRMECYYSDSFILRTCRAWQCIQDRCSFPNPRVQTLYCLLVRVSGLRTPAATRRRDTFRQALTVTEEKARLIRHPQFPLF
ncbi:hypothetical protein FRAAL0816 [Frankia alni ACN14a]|uniref:Uncharacterized protein n=1 Tax=Frankia alni (strain DSM 45986 / CECT 9034 / ACN14a) TaxID=326424 RepID=Q0RSH7_FRAAA|nr:hypothetical protein FRAAL0816 [Frankia alni ACN14a]